MAVCYQWFTLKMLWILIFSVGYPSYTPCPAYKLCDYRCMPNSRKPSQPGKWTSLDEEDLALEISEDKRLLRLGINPDANPIAIMIAVHRKAAELRDAQKKQE
jgi:hypothetical protein